MVAIPERAERVLQAGWSALRQRAASPDGNDLYRRLPSVWTDHQCRRFGWMTYRREGLDTEGRGETGIPWVLVPAYAARNVSRIAQFDFSEPIHFHHFLSCSPRAPRRSAAQLGTQGRSTNLSIAASAADS
jgi:hypothetical protein